MFNTVSGWMIYIHNSIQTNTALLEPLDVLVFQNGAAVIDNGFHKVLLKLRFMYLRKKMGHIFDIVIGYFDFFFWKK